MIMGYIDPSSGSVILQLIAGGVVGGLFIVKLYWHKFKDIIAELKHRMVKVKF